MRREMKRKINRVIDFIETKEWFTYFLIIFSISDLFITHLEILLRIIRNGGVDFININFLWNFVFTNMDDVILVVFLSTIYYKYHYKSYKTKKIEARWMQIMKLDDDDKKYKSLINIWLLFSILLGTVSSMLLILLSYEMTTGGVKFGPDVSTFKILLIVVSFILSFLGIFISILLFKIHVLYRKKLNDE